MKIRLYNAKILTSPLAKIIDGEVLINNGFIVNIISKNFNNSILNENSVLLDKEDSFFVADKEINCNKNLIISSFCNTHSHSGMSFFRGLAENLNLNDWLNKIIFPLEEKLTKEDIYYATLLQLAEFARNGITTFADMYYDIEMTAKAALENNFACALVGGMTDYKKDTNEVIALIESSYKKFNNVDNRLKYFPGVHSEYTCSEKLLEYVADFAIESGAKTNIHLSETLKEVGECSVRHNNMSPVMYLESIGFFDNGGIAAHCTYCDKEDLDILKQYNVSPVINSSSNLKLASGIPPVYSMLQKKMNVTIGTDGMASNNSCSIFKEMYLFSCLQKENLKMAEIILPEECLCAATINGYKALNFENLGEIKKGFYADLVLIDLNTPNFIPNNNIKNNLVYSADTSNVIMTMAKGKIIYNNGEYFLSENIDKIFKESKKRIKRIIN